MPAQGQSQTEETKKKISEALYQGGPKDTTSTPIVRSPEAQDLFDEYIASMTKTEDLRAKRDAIKAKIKAVGRKKTGKAAKDKAKKELADIRAKLKTEMAVRKELRTKVMEFKHVKVAKAYLEKAKINKKHLDIAERRSNDLLGKTKKPETKQRIQDILDRIKLTREKYKTNKEKANAVITSKGVSKKISGGSFNFSEEFLFEQDYSPYRTLTEQEKRCNLEYLNEQFNELQTEMEKELTQMTNEEIDKFLKTAENRISAGDIAAIALLGLMIRGKVKKVIDEKLVAAYEAGKKTATNEINKSAESPEAKGKGETIERSATPLEQTQIKNLDVNDITNGFISEVEQTGKGNIKNALVVGATIVAIITTTRDKMKKSADRMINNITNTLIGQYVNRGRKQVFTQNIKRIAKFQRSEILDGRTCATCVSIDKKVVATDDPMAQMDLVHSHCRGIWIPIFVIDEEQPDVTGIPTSIMDNFDLVDGRPVINSFKQLKKPIK